MMICERLTVITFEFRVIGIGHCHGAVVGGLLVPRSPANQMVAPETHDLLSH